MEHPGSTVTQLKMTFTGHRVWCHGKPGDRPITAEIIFSLNFNSLYEKKLTSQKILKQINKFNPKKEDFWRQMSVLRYDLWSYKFNFVCRISSKLFKAPVYNE